MSQTKTQTVTAQSAANTNAAAQTVEVVTPEPVAPQPAAPQTAEEREAEIMSKMNWTNAVTREQANASLQDEDTAYLLRARRIVSVYCYEGNSYVLTVDGEPFQSYNRAGEAIETNSFSMKLGAIAKQLAGTCPALNIAYIMGSAERGQRLNPRLVALCLHDAYICVLREHKEQGEQREHAAEGATYEQDCWRSTIVGFLPNPDPAVAAQAADLIENKLTVPMKEEKAEKKPTVSNLFASLNQAPTEEMHSQLNQAMSNPFEGLGVKAAQ